MVGLNRIVLLPAFTDTVTVFVAQVAHAPVLSNGTDCTIVPLTTTSAGRAVVVPLAKEPTAALPQTPTRSP
ncbi:hypothetical protein [Micromonospora deserti]|uniref:hypothetical protein n=1 Tax=Micromonospora deserti TaxID=2070366 RepID=UPI001F1A0D08|nr:hypothetical protein [Micromonospora deserti]